MDEAKRARLEAAGWVSGDAADVLGMDESERAMLEFRRKVMVEVRRLRKAGLLTQVGLAKKARTSQSRITAIENAAPGIGLDLLVRVLFAAGGKLEVIEAPPEPKAKPVKPKTSKSRASKAPVA